MKFTEGQSCKFSSDLVSYLYEEISPAESRIFEAHLKSCKACRSEFAEFTAVRDAVGVWRNEILAVAPSSPVTDVPRMPVTDLNEQPKRSAMAAFREFFSLSPMWLRGVTAFGALAVCTLLIFSVWKVYNPERVVVRETVQLASSKAIKDQSSTNVLPETARNEEATLPVETPTPVTRKLQNRSAPMRRHNSPAPQRAIPVQGSQQYAVLMDDKNREILSDLGLVSSRDEEATPRLSDLVVDPESNN